MDAGAPSAHGRDRGAAFYERALTSTHYFWLRGARDSETCAVVASASIRRVKRPFGSTLRLGSLFRRGSGIVRGLIDATALVQLARELFLFLRLLREILSAFFALVIR